MPLCWICDQITPWTLKQIPFDEVNLADPELCNPHHRSFLELQKSAIDCELCKLMCNSLLENKYIPGATIWPKAPVFLCTKLNPYADLQIQAPQLHNIIVQCGEGFTKLLAFADPQSEAARSNAVIGRLPLDPDSYASSRVITSWLENCIRTHPSCRVHQIGQTSIDLSLPEGERLPPRSLDVGDSTSPTVRLIESSHIKGQYVTLSHRWPIDPSNHFTTTRSSIDSRKRGFSLEDMPPTFRDAVKATRKLGLRYLWIDSLCIIQNDTEDWERQSKMMGDIYYRSAVTIMAATNQASSGNPEQEQPLQGFLSRPPAPEPPTVQLDYFDQDWTQKGKWFIRGQKRHHSESLDLFTRGWVMQEQLLSRRKLMYAPDQLIWECNTMPIFEVERERIMSSKRYMNSIAYHEGHFTDHWLGIAIMFSQRSLTFETDRLPALSGLASFFSDQHGQEYHAGIFSGSIAETLLWAPYYPGCLSRPPKYIAPSWSWVALLGLIKMKAPSEEESGSSSRSAIEDVRFNLSPEGLNPYGQLKKGNMELTGRLITAKMRSMRMEAPLLMVLEADGKTMASFPLDLAEYIPLPPSPDEVKVLAVLRDNENVLVLRKVKGSKEYERMGIAEVDPGWFDSGIARKERITIV